LSDLGSLKTAADTSAADADAAIRKRDASVATYRQALLTAKAEHEAELKRLDSVPAPRPPVGPAPPVVVPAQPVVPVRPVPPWSTWNWPLIGRKLLIGLMLLFGTAGAGIGGYELWLHRPTPAPGPGPGPGPPGPHPAPPIAEPGYRVLIVVHDRKDPGLTREQSAAVHSADVRKFLTDTCVKDSGGNAEWRLWDEATDPSADSKPLQDMMKLARASTPWLIVGNGKTGYQGPLPANADELMKILKSVAP
jgi:hypothetical protein